MAACRISLDLLRKRAEHNEGEISTLTELSLHQQNLCRIELLDTACRDLTILLLQNNLIPKIENIGKLKQLEYLNLALNNIKCVENLERCESLFKLDLTVNFIADLPSIQSLGPCENLRELYLTGNPCTSYPDYREYVIATLPQISLLDGIRVTKSDRIKALQVLKTITPIIEQQSQKEVQKDLDRLARLKRNAQGSSVSADANTSTRTKGKGSDWYCSPHSSSNNNAKDQPKIVEINTDDDDESSDDNNIDPDVEKAYWDKEEEFTPESRVDTALHTLKIEEKKERAKAGKKKKKKPKRNFFKPNGQAYNMNDAGLAFTLEGQWEASEPLVLDLECYKYLDTSAIDLDVQPTYVKVTFKDKVFQLAFGEEVNPDRSKAERSKITGYLMVTMPKVNQILKPVSNNKTKKGVESRETSRELLDVKEPDDKINIAAIMRDHEATKTKKRERKAMRENDEDFVDDDDVPPLE